MCNKMFTVGHAISFLHLRENTERGENLFHKMYKNKVKNKD